MDFMSLYLFKIKLNLFILASLRSSAPSAWGKNGQRFERSAHRMVRTFKFTHWLFLRIHAFSKILFC